MSPSFFKRLLGTLCPHRFSWPPSGTHVQDYQVCLICGTPYEYDWMAMRRTGRLMILDVGEVSQPKPAGR
jgi:hypothetical protein